MTRWLFLAVWFGSACNTEALDPSPSAACDGMFGEPSSSTGLSRDECVAEVTTTGWVPTLWSGERVSAARGWTLVDPVVLPSSNPYNNPLLGQSGGVCTVDVVSRRDRSYRLVTAEAAADASGPVTHGGACGACSSLQDLAVYAANPDLTEPVRSCSLQGFTGGLDAVEACLMDIGFSSPCARIWAWNAEHTREQCLDVCLSALDDPYHSVDGSLNSCLQCDEDESGPVFKQVAGRTRRNSGLASALCRPCETVWQVDHTYLD
jgi:hypothetical protein